MGNKSKVYWLTTLLTTVAFLSVYLVVFQSYHYGGNWLAALAMLLLFFSILILQFLWINVSSGSFWSSSLRTLAVVVIMVPIVFGLTKAENKYENGSLQAHGVNDTRIISYTYKTNNRKSGIFYHAVYQYNVNGENYTHTLTNKHDIYHVGDSVHIIYSTQHPNIDKVITYKLHL